MSKPKSILDKNQLQITVNRLCHQLIEHHKDFSNTVIVGLQPRGVLLADRLKHSLSSICKGIPIKVGSLDITFYRDDFRRREQPLIASNTSLDVSLEGKNVIVVDDVLF